MTADAKVGLLLGLVFIVIIAFLVNGLPNFFRGSAEAGAAYGTTVAELPMPNLILENPRETPSVRQNSVPIPLRQVEQPRGEVVVQIPGRPAAEQAVEEPVVVRETIAPRETVTAREAEAVREAAGAAAAVVQPRTTQYIVKTGETLTSIAVRVYGPETGRSKATLDRIAESNGLKSADILQVGQVLTLPDLDGGRTPAQISQETAPHPLLKKHPEQLEPVRGQVDRTSTVQPAAKKPEYVEHTVKRGESLSEISSRYLGTARRVDDIVKMNPGVIRSADDIRVGMVVKLPKN